MKRDQVQAIAISSAVAAAAGAVASAIVAAAIAKASEKRAKESAEASVWTILGEQQQSAAAGLGSVRVQRVSLWAGARLYVAWVEARLQLALARIANVVATTPMTDAERQQIGYDVAFSAKTIRARLVKVAKDGTVTETERTEMWMLASAIQTDLRRLHGDIDSWWLI